MSHAALDGFINRLAIHTELTGDEVHAIRGLPTTFAVVSAHRNVVHPKQRTEHSYFIIAGMIGRYSQGDGGIRQFTALHIAGDMADLCSVVFPRSSWTFQALTNTDVLRIPHTALREVARQFPGIGTAFWRDCVVDISVMSESMMTLGRRNAEARVAHLLCEISCRLRRAGIVEQDRFAWQLTQVQVADMLGLTYVHVNRMYRSLREMGLATVSRGQAEIHDFRGLAKLGSFDPSYLYLERG